MAAYDLAGYAAMMNHEERVSAYHEAIRAAVKPGAVVLEIGSATGFMALLACKYGARRVYAIEPADAILAAPQLARDNGFGDRIVFHRALSTQVELPERCDILISDLRGSHPCHTTHLVDLMDARNRLLTPNAAWICQTDTFYVAVSEAPKGRGEVQASWDGSRWGLDLSAMLPYATSCQIRRKWELNDLLSASEAWTAIHYPSLTSPHVHGAASLVITRDAPAQGFALWFEAELFGGARFSNAPGKPQNVYGNMFLPWPKVVDLLAGDRVEARLDALLYGNTYEWSWRTVVRRPGQEAPVAEFKQSTVQGHLLDSAALARCLASYQLRLSPAGEEERFLLARADGRISQGELAALLRVQFPERFPDDAAAFARVAQTTARFSD